MNFLAEEQHGGSDGPHLLALPALGLQHCSKTTTAVLGITLSQTQQYPVKGRWDFFSKYKTRNVFLPGASSKFLYMPLGLSLSHMPTSR